MKDENTWVGLGVIAPVVHYCLICASLIAFVICDAISAEEPSKTKSPSAWITRPSSDGEMTDKDRIAREGMLRIIEKLQTDEFRKVFVVDIPEQPTGLPDDYDIILYGKYNRILFGTHGLSGLVRLEINVRGDRAAVECVTEDGIRIGTMPVETIDPLARGLCYGFMAGIRRKPNIEKTGSFWHRQEKSNEIVEIISRDKKHPLHLKSSTSVGCDMWLSQICMDVQAFAHTCISLEMELMSHKGLEEQMPNDLLDRELVGRLRRMRTPKEQDAENVYRRDDLASVESRLYSCLAVRRRLKQTMPDLQRLGVYWEAKKLEVFTASDPTELLIDALSYYTVCDDWSFDFVKSLPNDKQVEVLLRFILSSQDYERTVELLDLLRQLRLTKDQIARLEKLYVESKKIDDEYLRVAVTGAMLMLTGESAYYDQLMKKTVECDISDNMCDCYPDFQAVKALIEYSETKGKNRNETAMMIRTLLAQLPKDNKEIKTAGEKLIRHLGITGDSRDVPLLVEYADSPNTCVAACAIEGLAHLDVNLAMKKLHRQLDNYVDSPDDYTYTSVRIFHELIFWHCDSSFIDKLEQVLKRDHKEKDMAETYDRQATLLIKYLQAETADERLSRALDYVEQSSADNFSTNYIDKVVGRLISSGADREKCKRLLDMKSAYEFHR